MKQQKLELSKIPQEKQVTLGENKKVLITFTLFTEDGDYMDWFVNTYISQVAGYLKYELLKQTTGKHIDCNRPHFHVCCLYQTNGAKIIKYLSEKILRFNDIYYWHPDVATEHNRIDKKITFIYEGQQKKFKKKVKLYDESGLQYPFKEYDNFGQIPVDLCSGFDELELEQMRKCANIEWLNLKRIQSQQLAQEIEKKNMEIKMNDYLKEKLQHIEGDFRYLVKETITALLQFKKQETTSTSFRVMGLKDQAISYLYFNGKISEIEIIQYLDI